MSLADVAGRGRRASVCGWVPWGGLARPSWLMPGDGNRVTQGLLASQGTGGRVDGSLAAYSQSYMTVEAPTGAVTRSEVHQPTLVQQWRSGIVVLARKEGQAGATEEEVALLARR